MSPANFIKVDFERPPELVLSKLNIKVNIMDLP